MNPCNVIIGMSLGTHITHARKERDLRMYVRKGIYNKSRLPNASSFITGPNFKGKNSLPSSGSEFFLLRVALIFEVRFSCWCIKSFPFCHATGKIVNYDWVDDDAYNRPYNNRVITCLFVSNIFMFLK